MNEKISLDIHDMFSRILEITPDFDDDDLFIELGGQSILMGKLQNEICEKYNVFIPFEKLFEFGTVNGLTKIVEEELQNGILNDNNIVKDNNDVKIDFHKSGEVCTPYPMTDLQVAYFVGRNSDTELGGNPTRGYSEIICKNYDHQKMKKAIEKLFCIHDVMRCHFNEDGTQNVEKSFEFNDFKYEDISEFDADEQEKFILAKRERIFNNLFDIFSLPLVRFEATKLNDEKTILHFSHDGMIIDGWSHEMLIYYLDKYYTHPDDNFEIPEISFVDYVNYLEEIKKTNKYEEDKEYWMQKMNSGLSKPALPLKQDPSKVKNVNTRQVVRYIEPKVWEAVKSFAYKNKLTPFSVIFTAFGKAISKYSASKNFLMNMPVSVRPKIHKDIDMLLGECSNFFIFDFDGTDNRSIYESALSNQQKVAEIMQHNYFMGTDCIRELQKKEGAVIAAPIVFTSIVDVPDLPKENLTKIYTKTHTSQVWIDAIAMRKENSIMLTMDSVEELFDESVTDGIGDTFVMLLNAIYEDETSWLKISKIELTDTEKKVISECTENKIEYNMPLLSELFLDCYNKYENETAVITENNKYSFHQIYNMASCIADIIRNNSKNKIAAIYLEKSEYMPVSALACVMSGCAYYPFELELPIEQIANCIERSGADIIVTTSNLAEKIKEVNGCTVIEADKKDYNYNYKVSFDKTENTTTSYIINTSGTTGTPKSIKIKQAGLVNCLIETIKTCKLTNNDRLLALTNYCHDMSVFDMFDIFVSGSAVVIPTANKEKDPYHWIELIRKYNVTFWNSVPALLEILMESDAYQGENDFVSMKNVLLGGERINVNLIKRARSLMRNASFRSVGGPSETTVWNIWHEITDSDEELSYIIYGKPIANTNYYILDNNNEICPPYKEGVMFVEGIGVADGYIGREEKSKNVFVTIDGKNLYNTGDCGLYLSNGDIRILGRLDKQVKINGKRIELDGICEAINAVSEINSCAVILDENKKSLVAFYVAKEEISSKEIVDSLKRKLPQYMIPVKFIYIDEMPLTTNGKIDEKALKKIAEEKIIDTKEPKKNNEKNYSELELEILELCKVVMDNTNISIDDDFFEMGGNSIYAIKLLTKIKNNYGVMLTIYDILNTPEISSWSNLIAERLEK